jgi:peptidoglycan hydrolase-like protein with peptidoglycan-binding domain
VKRKALLWTVGPLVIGTAVGAVPLLRQGDATVPVAAVTSTGTARVVRTDLSNTVPMFGTLGFAAPVTVIGTTGGRSYTWLPAPGSVIHQGEPLYEVDGRPVPLLAGDRPVWRALSAGVAPGPDIAQLNTALVELGYAHGITGDARFLAATSAAVRRWQRALGLPVTGRVDLGEVVFAHAPLRVQSVSAGLGMPPAPGAPLLVGTATDRVVDLPVPVDRAYLLHVSDPVTVTLPDAHTTTPGTVSAVSPVAVAGTDQSGGRPGVSTVDVSVRLADPAAVAAYTTAPVSVNVTTAKAAHVLAVPVTALSATPGGGFAVTVVDHGTRRPVSVEPGLFSETLVEVSGAGLSEGDTVEVPS